MKFEWSRRKAAFLVIFVALSLVAMKVNFSTMLGASNQSFTFFQFLAPIGGGIFSSWFGAAAALLAQGLNFAVFGGKTDLFSLLRFLPPVFAAIYFGSRSKWNVAVPLACMALFWMHPVGSQAPFYALFWLIPVAAKFAGDNLLIRSLGTTFTAHAVGSVAFLYTLPSQPLLWFGLIPVVMYERLVFTLGIAVSFIVVSTLLDALSAKVDLRALRIERRYSLAKAIE